MYHALFALCPKLLRFSGQTYISISVPGGAIGVLPKLNSPSITAHADNFGFCRHGCTIFNARSICFKRRHQYDIGNVLGSGAITDLKHDVYMCAAFFCWGAVSPGRRILQIGLLACGKLFYLAADLVVHSDLWSSGLNTRASHYLV